MGNNTEVICINNSFSSDVLSVYAKYGVKIPEKDKVYSIRTKQIHSNGLCGIRLNELNNNKIPLSLESSLLSDLSVEPSWKISRFTDLLGNPLKIKETEIELEEEVKKNKTDKEYLLKEKTKKEKESYGNKIKWQTTILMTLNPNEFRVYLVITNIIIMIIIPKCGYCSAYHYK